MVPSLMLFKNMFVIAKFTCLELIRHRALWAIIVLATVLSCINIVFTQLFSWDLGKVSVEFGLSSISLSGLLLVFFLGLKVLADDIERESFFMIFSRPVTVEQYVFGKFLGLCGILFFLSTVLTIAASVAMAFVIKDSVAFVPVNFSWGIFLMAAFCQYLQLMVVTSVCVLCFCFASSSFVALLFSFSIYCVGQNLELLRKVIVQNAQAGVLSGQENVVIFLSWIFPNLSLFDKKYVAAYGFSLPWSEFLLLAVYGLSYSFLLVFVASFLFRRNKLR